jgi:hypothetical protein
MSEAKQSQSRIFFAKKDEAFINKGNLKRISQVEAIPVANLFRRKGRSIDQQKNFKKDDFLISLLN